MFILSLQVRSLKFHISTQTCKIKISWAEIFVNRLFTNNLLLSFKVIELSETIQMFFILALLVPQADIIALKICSKNAS